MEKSRPIDTSSRFCSLKNWHLAPSNSQNFDFLDGIRGIAILMVVFSHLFYINPSSTGIVKFIGNTLEAGTLGVTVFFTLSGFLISLPFWKYKQQNKAIPLKNYFLRRFWKIYPPLALSVILLVPIYIWIYGDTNVYFKTAIQWLSGIAWLIPVSGKMNPVMWSLIVEVHFYILLPLLFIGLKKLSYSKCLWIIFLGLFLIPIFAKSLYAMNGLEFSLHPVIHTNFPVKLDAFAPGVLLAGLYQQKKLHECVALLGPLGLILLACTLAMIGVSSIFPAIDAFCRPSVVHYSTVIASTFLLCFVANPELARRFGLCFWGLRWIGLISYEWYLFHQAPHIWARYLMGSAQGDLLKYLTITILPLIGSLFLAAIIYWKFSLPFLRRYRN